MVPLCFPSLPLISFISPRHPSLLVKSSKDDLHRLVVGLKAQMVSKKADSDRRLFIACGVLALVNILVTNYWPTPWGADLRLKRPLVEYHPPSPGPSPNITYRNHFADIGVSDEDVQARVKHMMDMYLYGDLKEERLYFPAGNGLIQVVDVGKDQVHSEAMSYGMMVAVQLDLKDVFDKM